MLAWICAVPEARAKSLADEGALGKPCGGMQHNEEMGVVVLFHGFSFFFCSPAGRLHQRPVLFPPAGQRGGGLQGADSSMNPLYLQGFCRMDSLIATR